MRLFEYMGKELLSRYGVPIPKGYVVNTPDEIKDIPYSAAVKAQVLTGGRGKAGGIRFAQNVAEARQHASDIMKMTIHGEKVRCILIEERLQVAKELYFSFTLDRSSRSIVMMSSAEGGVEIESVPHEKILIRKVPPSGYSSFLTRALGVSLGLSKEQLNEMEKLARSLLTLFMSEDCELVEINPLVITKEGKLIAADSKITINDDALFRHPEYAGETAELTPLEAKARKEEIAFVQLDGDIGVIANGAGLTMATLDTLNAWGGKAGVFLDLGGTDNPEKVAKAFELLKEATPRVIFLNIFGGITKCDTVALGIKAAVERDGLKIPVVARIRGVNEEEAVRILSGVGITATTDMTEAAKKAAGVK
ncbi:MAG: ADP-forming succinate--CoA ligase subunit beta [Methanomassiliicoccales archaeon]